MAGQKLKEKQGENTSTFIFAAGEKNQLSGL
jgi:hypothetical protein